MVNLEAIFHGHNFICMIILAYHHTYVHNSIFQLQQIVASKGRIRTETSSSPAGQNMLMKTLKSSIDCDQTFDHK